MPFKSCPKHSEWTAASCKSSAVNSRLLVRRQKKHCFQTCCGEHLEQTVDDAWQIVDTALPTTYDHKLTVETELKVIYKETKPLNVGSAVGVITFDEWISIIVWTLRWIWSQVQTLWHATKQYVGESFVVCETWFIVVVVVCRYNVDSPGEPAGAGATNKHFKHRPIQRWSQVLEWTVLTFLQHFDTVGWVFWPVKLSPR